MNYELNHILSKLYHILQTVYGWIAAVVIFLADYCAGHRFIIFLALAVTLMDAVWGVAVSLKRGKFTLSELLRLTVAKLAVYGCALLVFVGLDRLAGTSITASVVGSAIVLVEFWSSCAAMLILFPWMPFLRLMKKALTGEIAAKLNIPVDEVESALNTIHKKSNE